MKNILSTNNLRTGAAWLFLIIGLILYWIGFFYFDDSSLYSKISIKIADVLVIGVVLGFITNAAQFIGIFKQDLQDIIYGKEFIKQRKDIYPLWENLSKELFKNKFPSLHKELLNTVNGYLPKDEVSYYNDYEIHTSIEWVDKDKGIIKVTDKVSFDLISETTDEIMYPIKSWTKIKDRIHYTNSITQITVNGNKPTDIKYIGERQDVEGSLCQEQQLSLQGFTKYEIKYTREKTYNIDDDYYVGFRAKYIVNKLRVCLVLPNEIEAIFTSRGTQKDFEDIINKNNQIERRYRGIVLPRQGYIFSLKQKTI
jgi:hypothetical protein